MSKQVIKQVKVTKTYADFATAGLTSTVDLIDLPARALIHAVVVNPTTVFSGGTIATYTVSVGITGSLDKYSAAKDVFTGSALVDEPAVTATNIVESLSDDTDVVATAVSTVGNLDAATQGSVDIHIYFSILD